MKPRSICHTISASLTALALILFPTSSILADQVQLPEFLHTGHYPNTVYVSISTPTSGATIFYTKTLWPNMTPADPIHDGSTPINCQVYNGPLGVGNGQYAFIKAVAYKAGMTDSSIEFYEWDNRGL